MHPSVGQKAKVARVGDVIRVSVKSSAKWNGEEGRCVEGGCGSYEEYDSPCGWLVLTL